MNRGFRGAGWLAWALLGVLLFAPLGCKRGKRVQVQKTEEAAAPGMASTIHMGDPRMAPQLIAGFHGVENNAWRWTQRRFALVLHPPAGSAQKGAVLSLKLTVPPVVIEKNKDISLAASAGGTELAAEKYTKPGEYTYRRDLPASAVAGDPVRIDFTLDKAMAPGGADLRELGIVVSAAGLELK